jgi:hypothetical protein
LPVKFVRCFISCTYRGQNAARRGDAGGAVKGRHKVQGTRRQAEL